MRKLLAVLVVAAATAVPPHAIAQCGGGGGTHNHGTTAGDRKTSNKTSKMINHLLSTDATRRALIDAIVDDRSMMRLLLGRIAADPVWSVEAADALGFTLPEATDRRAITPPNDDTHSPVTPAYACPMHPDVTSAEPGKCPRCGMELERVRPQERP